MRSAFPSDRGDWVSMLDGVRISRAWMVRHTPELLAAWCDAATAEGRRAIATRILQIAADLESEPERGDDAPPDPAWRQIVARIDDRLVRGPDWLPLAAALARAAAGGYDVAIRLPPLAAAAPLPARHPARELHWRLLDDCAAALPTRGATDHRLRAHTARSVLHRCPAPPPRPTAATQASREPTREERTCPMTVDTVSDPLGYAASLLDAVGADREQVPADIALECLYAAELLERAGGRTEPVPLIDGDPAASIRAAMGALGLLDERTFASTPVLDAARAARRALRRLG